MLQVDSAVETISHALRLVLCFGCHAARAHLQDVATKHGLGLRSMCVLRI